MFWISAALIHRACVKCTRRCTVSAGTIMLCCRNLTVCWYCSLSYWCIPQLLCLPAALGPFPNPSLMHLGAGFLNPGWLGSAISCCASTQTHTMAATLQTSPINNHRSASPVLSCCILQEASSSRERCTKLEGEVSSLHTQLGSAVARAEVGTVYQQ